MTKKQQHTAQPWAIMGRSICAGDATIADMRVWDGGSSAEQRANARLIAAAPDLLDGCKALLGLLQLVCARDDVPPSLAAEINANHRAISARAAIARAEGRT